MKAKIEKKRDDLKKRLEEITLKSKSDKAWSRVYSLYQSLQAQRWMNEGALDGLKKWPELSSEYKEYKLKHYKDYPGGGSKILIATSTLAGAAIGPGSPFEGTDKHRAMFKSYSMRISVEESGNNAEGKPFIYPKYVAEKRPFMEFSDKSIKKLKDALKQYLVGK